jgi:hypothetical protein
MVAGVSRKARLRGTRKVRTRHGESSTGLALLNHLRQTELEKSVLARRQNQHARRTRYPVACAPQRRDAFSETVAADFMHRNGLRGRSKSEKSPFARDAQTNTRDACATQREMHSCVETLRRFSWARTTVSRSWLRDCVWRHRQLQFLAECGEPRVIFVSENEGRD